MTDFAPPRGMRDFYPEDWRAREALFSIWRATAERFGFEGWDAPVVETMELLERKAGEEISEQIYGFEDKSGRRLALRPELTPSLARMIIARQGSLVFPLKWSAIGQCFRYERMTRGRKREHYQWNLDIVGEESVMAEAEVIGAAVAALRAMGLTDRHFQVRVGSRSILSALFKQEGISEEHYMPCYLALDKKGKISNEEIEAMLHAGGLKDKQIELIHFLLTAPELVRVSNYLKRDDPNTNAAHNQLMHVFELAQKMGFFEYVNFDLSIVRGLGYYTGIVFEAFDTAGKFRAIFGGGRYDSLLAALGGEKMPCVGLGFGDVVIQELLTDLGITPGGKRVVDYAIGYMSEECRALSMQAATKLRAAGKSCDLGLSPEKAKKFFSRADKTGAERAIYIGPSEAESGKFNIKTMAGGETVEKTIEDM